MKHLFEIQNKPLDIRQAEAFLYSSKDGGVVLFAGNIRESAGDRKVKSIFFEAYDEMVIAELERISINIQTQFNISKIVLIHRVGEVLPGETAVIAGIASKHRKEAFEACSELMNRLKASVPIWKKEMYEDGGEWLSPTP
jgi:molybdopterin synthase catalytic subunit